MSLSAFPSIVQQTSRLPAHHPYACARCRSRKVKCDKLLTGCANCSEAHAQCIYSARRPRKPHKAHPTPAGQRTLLPADASAHGRPSPTIHTSAISSGEDCNIDGDDDDDMTIPREVHDGRFETRESDGGRLFVYQGKSRFINSGKADQVADFETILAAEPNGDRKAENPSRHLRPAKNKLGHPTSNLLLTMSTPEEDLKIYYPSPEKMDAIWDHYVQNVDILIKILYKPATEALVKNACRNQNETNPCTEALLFAVLFASVMTMSAEQCYSVHGEEMGVMVKRYKYLVEKALAQAEWMTTQDVFVLQALTLHIIFAPGKNVRLSWMRSGIAMSIAQSMGLHRDGAKFSLSVVETEVRRRVWWSLCQLDNRISDDCGLETHMPSIMDTELPLNLNDSDLGVGYGNDCSSRIGFTEMTMSLIKIEIAKTSLNVKRLRCANLASSLTEVETLIRDQIRRYEEVYLTSLDISIHLHRLCYLGTRLIINHLSRMTFDISSKLEGAEQEDILEKLISYYTDVLEIARQLPDKSHRFGWFFGCKHTQWHAMTYLLLRLCQHTKGYAVDRAWDVLDKVFRKISSGPTAAKNTIDAPDNDAKKVLWQPLLRLLQRARYARNQSLKPHNDKSDAPSTTDSGYETKSLSPNDVANLEPSPDGLLGDPFLGFGPASSEDLSSEQMEAWIQSLQTDLTGWPDCIDCQTTDLEAVAFW